MSAVALRFFPPKKKISNTDQKTAFHKYDWETVQRSFNAILIFIFRGQVIEKKLAADLKNRSRTAHFFIYFPIFS